MMYQDSLIQFVIGMFNYLAGGYIATSIFFFCFPQLLYKRKSFQNSLLQQSLQGKRILRICHRGAPRYTTENTIEGFRKVITQTDMLEMDVCQTKDHILVVHHDKSLQRTCGIDKNVSDYNFDDLPPFKDEVRLDFAIGQRTITTNNEKIPTLQRVFQIFQGILIDIQLKTPTENSIKQLNRLIEQYDRKQLTIVGIRNSKQDDLHRLNPSLRLFYNDSSVLKLLLLYISGLLPFFPVRQQSLQIPLYTTEFHQWKKQASTNPMKVDLFFSGLKFFNFILKPLIWHLTKRGVVTMMWVCNQQQHFQRALKIGAHGIMTDDPYMLSSYLKNRKKLDKSE